jgi:hypothetical protein
MSTKWLNRTLFFSIWISSTGFQLSAAEANEGFFLEQLPAGKSVTLPRPAITFVPMTGRVTLTSTDLPQTVKLTPVSISAGALQSIKVAIFDPAMDRVKYINLTPGSPTLYNFHGLGSISMVPQVGAAVAGNMRIRIESDKPLEISR